ncbi:MAG TPA: hypothetical protein VK502_00865 [Candidatus Saccharimonadales bacterium]|nr:hypothetical protein [Candidatus Saccharimonadales bacterium]
MFRDVIVAIPSILAGDSSIVREELVPFFNFGSQFWGDGASTLTSSEEVRVSYSFWTAWVRYYQVLPFALVILNAISAFILFYAFHKVGRYVYKKSLFGVVAALLAALLIHVILLYAKIAHFYVLIIGFSMFSLSLSLLLEQLFFKQKIKKANVLAVSALTLLNPAIHYHVIFYVVAVLIIMIYLGFTAVMNRLFFWKYFRRSFIYFLLIVLLSLVPYVLYIFATNASSISGVSTQIPVNYWMIYYASLPLPFIFSLDTAGHLDLIRYGNYLAPIPRFGSMVVMFLIGGLFIFKRWKPLHIINKVFIMTLFIVALFAMWMALGYSENSPYSFHKVFGDAAIFFANTGTGIGTAIASLMSIFINILRFPHRFQFIYFYAVGVLFMISLVWLREVFMKKQRPFLASFFVIAIGLFPIVANNDYRTALVSGDLATFVTPYRVPDDLKVIKSRLSAQKDNRLFILPTLESGREIIQDGKSYSFLDKYLIYYLNEPTFYYGVGANTENKAISYLVYRAIAYNEDWWQEILANDLNVTDILVPKHVKAREKGITYLPGIDSKIQRKLATSSKYKKTYSGADYELYSLKAAHTSNSSTLIDAQWKDTLEYLNNGQTPNENLFFPLQIRDFAEARGSKKLMTTSVERSFYNLYVMNKPKQTFIPNPVSLPFNSQYVASSNFTNNALSLSTLYAKNDDYNYLHENVPSLMNLQRPSFVGLNKGTTTLDINATISQDGTYRLLLHAGSKGSQINAKMGDTNVVLQKLKDDLAQTGDFVDFSYFYADITVKKGHYKIIVKNTSQNSILVDSLTAAPKKNIPQQFSEVHTQDLDITPAETSGMYTLTVKGGKDEK